MSLLGVREVFTGAVSKEQELPPSLSACAEGSVWDAEEGRCQPRGRAEARALYPARSQPCEGMGLWWVLGDLSSTVGLLCFSPTGRNYGKSLDCFAVLGVTGLLGSEVTKC